MAEISNKTGFIEDNFQIIKSVLEDENNIDAEFELVLEDIGINDKGKTYICSSCGKQYSSNSGLKRHEKMKHNIVPTSEYFVIDGMKFGQIIIEATTKLGADKCFPHFQDSFRHFVLTDEETDEIWKIFQPAIKSYKGDAENFFATCFKLL